MVPLLPTHACVVLQRLEKRLGLRSLVKLPGIPVDILTLSQCRMPADTTCVTPKYDGERMLCMGADAGPAMTCRVGGQPHKRSGGDGFDDGNGRRRVAIHFINRSLKVFYAGIAVTHTGVRRSACNFILDGELCTTGGTSSYGGAAGGAPVSRAFFAFDTVLHKGKTCLDCRSLCDRLNFAAAILHGLGSPTCVLPRHNIRLLLKPFYGFDSRYHVADTENHDIRVDGVIFADTRDLLARPLKWKPSDRVTCDYLLKDNCRLFAATSSEAGAPLVYVNSIDQPCIPHAPEAFVECRYDDSVDNVFFGDPAAPATPLPPGRWVVVGYRHDRCHPNSIHVVRRNVDLMVTQLSLSSVVARKANGDGGSRSEGADCSGSADDSKGPQPPPSSSSYYAPNAVKRSRSLSLAMKNFHCGVKSELYRANMEAGQSRRVLELGVGRGADMARIASFGCQTLQMLVCVDVDNNGLKKAQQRWQALAATCAKRPTSVFRQLDLCDADATARFAGEYAANGGTDRRFDLVSAHFSAHYFMNALPAWLPDVVRPNGVFVCTLFDGEVVKRLLDVAADGTVQWVVDGVLQASLRLVDSVDSTVGRTGFCGRMGTVAVWIDTIGVEQVESLWHIDDVVATMAASGLQCVERRPFAEFRHHAFHAKDPMRTFSDLNVALVFRRRRDD